MAATEAYCVKCRKTVEIKDPREVTMKNGRPATQGTCPTCGTGVFRIGGGASKASGTGTAPKAASGSKSTTKKND